MIKNIDGFPFFENYLNRLDGIAKGLLETSKLLERVGPELYLREIVNCILLKLGVLKPLYQIGDFCPGAVPREIDFMQNAFVFEGLEEALGNSVVMKIAAPAQSSDKLCSRKNVYKACHVKC